VAIAGLLDDALRYGATMFSRGRLVATIAAAVLALTPSAADALPCADVTAYPGDGAARTAIAQWMAYGASLTATPRELPVMGALVESGLTNLRGGDRDTAGYFQTRMGIWNLGEYAGFPDSPPLQLKWFLDQAAIVRRTHIAAGKPDPAVDPNHWGDWIADVLQPAEHFRGRYQLRLDEARTLVDVPCTPPAAGEPPLPASSPSSTDRTAPALRLSGARRQRALRDGAIVLTARCPTEPCAIFAAATIALPRARRAPEITLRPRALAAGAAGRLRFVLGAGAGERIRAVLRSRPSVTASVRVTAIDAAGNRSTRTRTVRVTG
jgi:hypothetical protein